MTKSVSPELSIIIVAHNSAPFLRQTLDSLSTQQGVIYETIVVDNQSSDDTLALLRRQYPHVRLYRRPTSVGFAAANNLGVKHARAKTLLFLNPDVSFTTPTDLKLCLLRLAKDPQIGALSPRVNLVSTGGIDATCHRGFPTPWASFTHFSGLSRLPLPIFNQYTKRYLGYEHEHDIDAVGGMFMLVPRVAGDAIGWWDEAFEFYGEDLDFCYRLREHGYRVRYYPKVTVFHYKGATTGMSKSSRDVTTASRATTRQVKKWSILAMERFYQKHYQAHTNVLLNFLVRAGIRLLYWWRVGL